MIFEHLLQINDALNPAVALLTRAQLWQGLLLRAEQPQLFMTHLDQVRIVVRGEYHLARELKFGSFTVRDRVRLEPMQRMLIETDASAENGRGLLTITIEEPASNLLQLRFKYEIHRARSDEAEQEALYDRFIQSAYVAADIDCVRLIRHYAASGAPIVGTPAAD